MSIYQTCISDFKNLELLSTELTCKIFEYLSFGNKHPNIENIEMQLHQLIEGQSDIIELIGIVADKSVYYIKKKDIHQNMIDLYRLHSKLGLFEIVGIINNTNKSIQLLNGENI